jgi:hypothetical protein
MRFNFKSNCVTLTDINDASVLTDTNEQCIGVGSLLTKLLEMYLGRFIGAVLGPHDRVHSEL